MDLPRERNLIERVIDKVNQDLVERMKETGAKEPEEASVMIVASVVVVVGGPLKRAQARQDWMKQQFAKMPVPNQKALRQSGTSHAIFVAEEKVREHHLLHEMLNIHMTPEGVQKVKEMMEAYKAAQTDNVVPMEKTDENPSV